MKGCLSLFLLLSLMFFPSNCFARHRSPYKLYFKDDCGFSIKAPKDWMQHYFPNEALHLEGPSLGLQQVEVAVQLFDSPLSEREFINYHVERAGIVGDILKGPSYKKRNSLSYTFVKARQTTAEGVSTYYIGFFTEKTRHYIVTVRLPAGYVRKFRRQARYCIDSFRIHPRKPVGPETLLDFPGPGPCKCFAPAGFSETRDSTQSHRTFVRDTEFPPVTLSFILDKSSKSPGKAGFNHYRESRKMAVYHCVRAITGAPGRFVIVEFKAGPTAFGVFWPAIRTRVSNMMKTSAPGDSKPDQGEPNIEIVGKAIDSETRDYDFRLDDLLKGPGALSEKMLYDQWGSRFSLFFFPESEEAAKGYAFELRSAGPDRLMGTPDDVTWHPEAINPRPSEPDPEKP